MKASLLFSFLFTLSSLFAQEVQWFQPGQEWYYNVYCLSDFGCGYTYYEVNGIATIGGEEASVLTKIYLGDFQEEPEIATEYLRFENDTAWRYSTIAEEWHMLWDMGAEVGDVWTIQEDVFYGYNDDWTNDEIPLFKVVVDSVLFWEEVPDSPLTNRRAVFVSPVINETEESLYTYGLPILEGVGPVGGGHGLIGNPTYLLLPLQGPYFQCFIENGALAYGSDQLAYGTGESPCFALGTSEVKEVDHGLIYPNPASETLFWDQPIDAIEIFDAQGKQVLQRDQIQGLSSLSVSELETGFYTVLLRREAAWFSQKLIIREP
jgi:hypothetical protein